MKSNVKCQITEPLVVALMMFLMSFDGQVYALSWSPPVAIAAQSDHDHHYEPSIAVDSEGGWHVIYDTPGCRIIHINSEGRISTIPICAGHSRIAIDQDDKLHIVYEMWPLIYYTNNTSGDWSPPRAIVTLPGDGDDSYYPLIAVDSEGGWHVVYTDFPHRSIEYINSEGRISTVASEASGSRSIAIDQDDKLHIVYWSWPSWQTYYTNNTSGDWSPPLAIAGGWSIAVDSKGCWHVVAGGYDGIKYINCEGRTSTISTGSQVTETSIAIDQHDNLHIVYASRPSIWYTRSYCKTHVLSVGIHYSEVDPREPELYGDDSAQEVADAFKRNFTNCETQCVKLVSGDPPQENRDKFINSIKEIKNLNPGDSFVFYINCHAECKLDERDGPGDEPNVMAEFPIDGRIVEKPSTGDEGFRWEGGGLSDDDFTELFAEAPADADDPNWADIHKLFIIDTCHAGGFWGKIGPGIEDGHDLSRLPQAAIIAVCPEDKLSAFKNNKGVLGQSVVRALDKLPMNAPITFEEFKNAIDYEGKIFETSGTIGYIQTTEDNWDFGDSAPYGIPMPIEWLLETAKTDDYNFSLHTRIKGDLDNDLDVDFEDFAILAKYWKTGADVADIHPAPEGDGIVDLKDLASLVEHWLDVVAP